MTTKEKAVAQLIEAQFPNCGQYYGELSFGSENESQLRHLIDLIYHVEDKDLPPILSLILYSLLECHPVTLEDDSSYSKLMLFLDAGYSDANFTSAVEAVERVFDVSIESAAIKRATLDQQILFKRCLSKQAEAIYEWLNLAETWECSKRLHCIDFESAKKFWKSLVQVNPAHLP